MLTVEDISGATSVGEGISGGTKVKILSAGANLKELKSRAFQLGPKGRMCMKQI